ncbi:19700_t:CDS:2 [Racocetra persica]|uniref:19700_t:CDS:1 n=1 Tax=Racocetra persica TaxID=160502 RepID=A0ACA9M3Z2_9GLOM|nr:19700_t:CDS:2 [Racocetra persica]
MLSNIKDLFSVQLIINNIHRISILLTPDPKFMRINLSLQICDKVIATRHVHYNTGVEIAIKILKLHNNSNETHLTHLHKTSKDLYQLVTTDLKEQDKLKQGYDCGHFCFEIDEKYNLNNKKAPVLAIVIENQADYGSLLAFALVFKIVSRSKSDEEVVEMEEEYRWIPQIYDQPNAKPMTTNNLTEQMYKTIEARIGNDIFFPIKCKTIAKDPFHLMDSIQIPSTSESPKNYGAKFHKPSQFSCYNMQIENNQEIYNENCSDSTITEISETPINQ